jgi:hypothetical protein
MLERRTVQIAIGWKGLEKTRLKTVEVIPFEVERRRICPHASERLIFRIHLSAHQMVVAVSGIAVSSSRLAGQALLRLRPLLEEMMSQ